MVVIILMDDRSIEDFTKAMGVLAIVFSIATVMTGIVLYQDIKVEGQIDLYQGDTLVYPVRTYAPDSTVIKIEYLTPEQMK